MAWRWICNYFVKQSYINTLTEQIKFMVMIMIIKIKLTELDKVQVVTLGTSQETRFYRLQQRSLLNFIGYLTYYAISHTISVNY